MHKQAQGSTQRIQYTNRLKGPLCRSKLSGAREPTAGCWQEADVFFRGRRPARYVHAPPAMYTQVSPKRLKQAP
eukprot:3352309-Pyramimonas_sp.AAC.2